MCATFNGNSSITIISFYSLTNGTDETDTPTVYKGLFSIVRYISPKNVLVIGGGMNTQMRKKWK